MVIMLFGVSNVGKTVTGKRLAEKLDYSFFDLDEEIKKRFQTTLEKFMHAYPFGHERFKIKGQILKDILMVHKDNMVIAVSPIYLARNFNALLDMEHVIAIELQDSEEHIFNRLVFTDENDNIYRDEAYLMQHMNYYLKDIHQDIVLVKKVYKKIKNKYFIDNRPVEQVVDDLIIMIKDIASKRLEQ